MTISAAYTQLRTELFEMYEEREASHIANMVMENITGMSKTDRLIHKEDDLKEPQLTNFIRFSDELLKHKPVQYVLQEAWFAGMRFIVNEDVLIPRPETEDLVEWMINSLRKHQSPHILDIGTGSGCIAIALKRKLPSAAVFAVDVSRKALTIAKRNAAELKTDILFLQADILDETEREKLPQFDAIVSNPPYVKRGEAVEMPQHVLRYEPDIALFVPDNDPLIFYHAIAAFGKNHLAPGGMLFFEINELLGVAVMKLLQTLQFDAIELKKDLQGKDRMVKAVLKKN